MRAVNRTCGDTEQPLPGESTHNSDSIISELTGVSSGAERLQMETSENCEHHHRYAKDPASRIRLTRRVRYSSRTQNAEG